MTGPSSGPHNLQIMQPNSVIDKAALQYTDYENVCFGTHVTISKTSRDSLPLVKRCIAMFLGDKNLTNIKYSIDGICESE